MTKWLGTGLLGFASGLVARFLLPGDDSMGLIRTTIFGVGGAYFGAFLGQQMGSLGRGQPAGFLWTVLGAMALLFLNRIL